MKNSFCRAVVVAGEGKLTRKRFCKNQSKTQCCYLCNGRMLCEISCAYLDTPKNWTSEKAREVERINMRIEKEITVCKEKIQKLTSRFAEGKIGEKAFLRSTDTLQRKIEELEKGKPAREKAPQGFSYII